MTIVSKNGVVLTELVDVHGRSIPTKHICTALLSERDQNSKIFVLLHPSTVTWVIYQKDGCKI